MIFEMVELIKIHSHYTVSITRDSGDKNLEKF